LVGVPDGFAFDVTPSERGLALVTTSAPVPEPTAAGLLILAVASLGLSRARSRRSTRS
jgi:hypothetical protein